MQRWEASRQKFASCRQHLDMWHVNCCIGRRAFCVKAETPRLSEDLLMLSYVRLNEEPKEHCQGLTFFRPNAIRFQVYQDHTNVRPSD